MKKSDILLKNISIFQILLLVVFTITFSVILTKTANAKESPSLERPADLPIKNLGTDSTPISSRDLKINNKKITIKTYPDGKELALDSKRNPTTLPPERGFWFLKSRGAVLGNLYEGLGYAVMSVGVTQMIGRLAGLRDETTNSLSASIGSGIMAGKITQGFATRYLSKTGGLNKFLGKGGPWIVGAGVAFLVFWATYSKEKKEVITFTCKQWEAPTGGKYCDECNKDKFRPCSEYRCRSLGQACRLVNAEASADQRKCVWVNPKDVNSPTIKPLEEYLSPAGLIYSKHSIRPPSLGVRISDKTAKDSCLKPFTPLKFGIETNEPAQCKIDIVHTNKYEEMQFYLGDSTLKTTKHEQIFRLPAPDSNLTETPGLVIGQNGIFNYFIRCRDENGNYNVDEYEVQFCVDKSPDTTPPIIENTSIKSGSPVQFGANNLTIVLYVNEASDCRWSITDKSFSDMENNMTCLNKPYQINAEMLYLCMGNLTGIKDLAENKYYFRCKDQPGKKESERNVNSQSHVLKLMGSQSLNILKVFPNKTILSSVSPIAISLEAETDDGASEGRAVCSFSKTGSTDDFIAMAETNNHLHKQILNLNEGTHFYYIRCIDAGGNAAQSNASFSIIVDKTPPVATRVYKEQPDALKIVTNEDAECVYSLTSCNYVFEEGVKMLQTKTDVEIEHYAKWKENTIYYIKCKDKQGNLPSPNECTIVAGIK